MEFKRILWPTDLSENAARALPVVNAISQKYQSEIHVVYVLEEMGNFGAWYGEYERSQIDKIREWEKTTAETRLNELCENHLKGCPLYIRHISVGDPAREILRLIDKEKADLVVMTARGRKGHFEFGAVAERIVKNSPVPTLIIPVAGKKSS